LQLKSLKCHTQICTENGIISELVTFLALQLFTTHIICFNFLPVIHLGQMND